MRTVILFLATLPAYGQLFSFGIIGGGIATEMLDPFAQDQWSGKRYTVGLTAEVLLPISRLSVEVDGLYRRAGQRNATCAFTSCFQSEVRTNIFEFPVLAKYRLWKRAPMAPFVEAGIAYQWVRHGRGNGQTWRTGPIVPNEVVDYTVRRFGVSMPAENNIGFVGGGGIEFRAGRIRMSPEFRYTRWNARYWESFGSRGFFTGSNLNQVEGLVSVRF